MLEEKQFKKKKIGRFSVKDLNVFYGNEKCMLVCPSTGTALCVSRNIADGLFEGCLSDDLAFVMVQRAMIVYDESRPYHETSHSEYPSFFLIDMTSNCNLGCRYCFRSHNGENLCMTDEMLFSICKYIADYQKKTSGHSCWYTSMGWRASPGT